MLKEIVSYLKQELTGYTIGTNLFGGFVPSTITNDHLVVIETGGSTQPSIKDYVEKTIQVLAVGSDYSTTREMAQDVYDLLHAGAGITLPTVAGGKEYWVNAIVAISAPQALGQDNQGRFIISTNFVFKAQDK